MVGRGERQWFYEGASEGRESSDEGASEGRGSVEGGEWGQRQWLYEGASEGRGSGCMRERARGGTL